MVARGALLSAAQAFYPNLSSNVGNEIVKEASQTKEDEFARFDSLKKKKKAASFLPC